MQKIFFKAKDGLKLCGIWHIPTIIIHGTNDKYVPYEDAKKYVNNLKKGKLITLKNGEHGFQDRIEDKVKAKQETLKFFLKNL